MKPTLCSPLVTIFHIQICYQLLQTTHSTNPPIHHPPPAHPSTHPFLRNQPLTLLSARVTYERQSVLNWSQKNHPQNPSVKSMGSSASAPVRRTRSFAHPLAAPAHQLSRNAGSSTGTTIESLLNFQRTPWPGQIFGEPAWPGQIFGEPAWPGQIFSEHPRDRVIFIYLP